jgi:predicted ribosome quality control (RQC) complex YloA/Tae2 family protein
VHNNFYFLRQLSAALQPALTGSVVSECFSQSKDELILRFEMQRQSLVIKASLLPTFSCLSFPDTFQRARRNSVDLFTELVGRRVTGIRQFNNERSFALTLSDNFVLLFKMHGNRTNIVLFTNNVASGLFRKNLTADLNLNLEMLDREVDWSYEHFEKHADHLKAVYFTFGKVVWKYLEDQAFFQKTLPERWDALQRVLEHLTTPTYFITRIEDKPVLSLLKTGEIQKIWTHPIEAANDFYYTFTQGYTFSKEKEALLTLLRTKLGAGSLYCEKNLTRLSQLKNDNYYRVWADLIMANLHAIPTGSEKVILENFYADQKPVEIKLKKDLSPQKNAELLYRKAKNQHMEIERLEAAVEQKQEELRRIGENMREVEAAADLKALRGLKAALRPADYEKKETSTLPYYEHQWQGYIILVGKNAQSNDVLISKHSHKGDLWLHAKDVAGSHVLLKYQSGKNFPKDVVEYAASLAAYNSKRKNESLCPVIVTPRKFVRKRKGDPAGAVIVEREEVILVEPWKPTDK